MLFPKRVWVGLADGSVSVAFRYWKRPTVKSGGTLHSAVGVLAIDSVDRMAIRAITPAEARAAGYESRARLLADLAKYRAPGTRLYRITFTMNERTRGGHCARTTASARASFSSCSRGSLGSTAPRPTGRGRRTCWS